MPLTNRPLKAKYIPPDTVYAFINNEITELHVQEFRTRVSDPLNDSIGTQNTYYKFVETGSLELEESKVYASKNALLTAMKGASFNDGWRLEDVELASLGNGSDLAGMDLSDEDLTTASFSGVIVDGVKFPALGSMPSNANTLAEIKALVRSYDKDTTLVDGVPIGL